MKPSTSVLSCASLRRAMMKTLDSCAAVTLRDHGGIYWVPAPYAEFVRRLQSAVEKIGSSRVYLLPVHSSADANRTLGDAAKLAIEDELGADRVFRMRLGYPLLPVLVAWGWPQALTPARPKLVRPTTSPDGSSDSSASVSRRGRANALFEKSCDLGETRACTDLAASFALGRGVPRDPARTEALRKKVCSLGDERACRTSK